MATQTLPCIYIPDDSSPNQRTEEKNLVFPPTKGFDDVVCRLLGCEFHAVETVFSEDEYGSFNGREGGLPAGQPFAIYEVYMDDNGNSTRPKNSLAARLLGRPKSHGPMIVVKLMCTKPRSGGLEVIRKERLTQSDLENAAFRTRRADYATKKAAHDRELMELFRRQGGIVLNLN